MSYSNVLNPNLISIIVSHQAIENFALTVKEIAQMLQSFGTELAETELPEDMYSIERILALRTEKYFQLKVWLIRSTARWDFWGLTVCWFDTHSSIPPMHLYVVADKIEHSVTVSVC